MYVHMCAWFPQRPEDVVKSPQTEVTGICELLCELETEPGSSTKAASVSNHWAIFPIHEIFFVVAAVFKIIIVAAVHKCVCVCACACAHVHTNTTECLQEAKRGVRSSGTKVSSNCKLHGISVGNWTGSSGRVARAPAHSSLISLRRYLFLYEMPQECIPPCTGVTLFSVSLQV